MRTFKGVVFFLLLLSSGISFGVCIDANGNSGRHPTVQNEFDNSYAVVIGRATKATNLSEDKSDPEGYTATIFRFHVSKLLRGHLPTQIDIRSENDSGRFPLDLKKEYLLFIQKDKQVFFVDNCGNSALLSESGKVLQELGITEDGI